MVKFVSIVVRAWPINDPIYYCCTFSRWNWGRWYLWNPTFRKLTHVFKIWSCAASCLGPALLSSVFSKCFCDSSGRFWRWTLCGSGLKDSDYFRNEGISSWEVCFNAYVPREPHICSKINCLQKISRALMKKFVSVEAACGGMINTVTVKTMKKTEDACENRSRECNDFNLSIWPLDAADVWHTYTPRLKEAQEGGDSC